MTEGHYAVIKYIADPGRSEALNIGILVWTNHTVRLSIDERAITRVVRENPQLGTMRCSILSRFSYRTVLDA